MTNRARTSDPRDDEAREHRPVTRTAGAWHAVEFAVLFVGVPAAFPLFDLPMALLFPVLFVAASACGIYLARDPGFDGRSFGTPSALRLDAVGLLRASVLGVLGLLALVLAIAAARALGYGDGIPPQVRPFALPLERPRLWLLVMLLYPVLSVYPQELVYRAFLFRRYRGLFASETARIAASTVAFAWAHVIFENVVAVALCLVGGWIFARTYARTHSVLVTTFEHAIYGCAVFTVGLGWFFYGGSVR